MGNGARFSNRAPIVAAGLNALARDSRRFSLCRRINTMGDSFCFLRLTLNRRCENHLPGGAELVDSAPRGPSPPRGAGGDESRLVCATPKPQPFNVQRSKFDVRCSMFDVRCSMFDVRCSMFDVRCSMFDVRCSMFDVRLGERSLEPKENSHSETYEGIPHHDGKHFFALIFIAHLWRAIAEGPGMAKDPFLFC